MRKYRENKRGKILREERKKEERERNGYIHIYTAGLKQQEPIPRRLAPGQSKPPNLW